MIDAKTAKKSLLSELATLLAADGFVPRMADQAFDLEKPFGQWIVHLSFKPYPGLAVDASSSVAVRIDAINKLCWEHGLRFLKDWMKTPTLADERRSGTIGSNLGNINGVGFKCWTISSVEQASVIAASIYSDVKTIGFPYLERYSNMGNVLKTLTSQKVISNEDGLPRSVARCERAFAAAFVLGDPDTIEAVVQARENFLSERDGDEARARVAAFVATLRLKQKNGELPKLEQ
jgi:hypothetical protein